MAITLDAAPSDGIELEDFLQFVDRSYKQIDRDALCEIAPQMARLSNNRSFLSNFILKELKDLSNFQSGNEYTAQTFMLAAVQGKFYVRANVWLPENLLNKENFKGEKKFYSFEYPHDHNFDFLTVGYLGSGYETEIYEYDRGCVTGNVGEHVALKFLERTTLPEHKLMIYRAGEDVHIQKLPHEYSISVNVLTPSRTGCEQFSFDIEREEITGTLRSTFSGQRWFVQAAAYLCDDNITDVLIDIASKHPSDRMRNVARDAIAVRWPEMAAEML